MVTQATEFSQPTTNAFPPSSRDFEAYRLVKVERKSTRAVSKLLRISQTRVCQVIDRVGEYLVAVTEPETDARREKQLAVAKQVAAAEIGHCKEQALRSYHRSCGKVQTVREVQNPEGQITRVTTTRENFGETRYLTTVARLAMIGGNLPTCTLPIAVRRTSDEIQADFAGDKVSGEIVEVAPVAAAEVENPSEVDCSTAASEQPPATLTIPKTDAAKLEDIRLYNRGMQFLNRPEQQIPETVHPPESTVAFERRPLNKLERKRLKRDQRKQRSAAKAS